METIHLDRAHDDRVRIVAGDEVLAEYVHRPADPQLESPRPYLSPIRTLAGEVVRHAGFEQDVSRTRQAPQSRPRLGWPAAM